MNVINVCVKISHISVCIQHQRIHTQEKPLSIGVPSLFHHQDIYNRPEFDIIQMEKITAIFLALLNIKILERKLLIICI